MTTRPVRGLTLAGGIGFLTADYDNLPLDPVTIVSGKLPIAPDAQASGSIEYETAVGSSLQLRRSDAHTSELQSLMRISYAVFGLNKQTKQPNHQSQHHS